MLYTLSNVVILDVLWHIIYWPYSWHTHMYNALIAMDWPYINKKVASLLKEFVIDKGWLIYTLSNANKLIYRLIR